ncbi:tRNA (cytidine(34)-2'-O)-methyltransferase [Tindallia californiensis]|uniref:Putative tRNA (cytidine(34)-2'-O)-methyltransferase n=1 Tax=Tindallia californiensis TaxID=159292 RepID=A0A1H3I8W9_9FIRM|nr:tRNA (cytidine(34)-2'-O)-methyltransferase [Tindallia californiensis]SDY24153.1 tRNA (cytidine/uridine-2'-O-)-methyltransferase [Tindallia californiensis]
MSLNIILHEPEIPQNTGNIARTCVIIGASLHIIKPTGFSLDDRYVKRAGLDYWDLLDLTIYNDFEDFLKRTKVKKIYCASTKAKEIYSDQQYSDPSFIMFGKETAGLPPNILEQYGSSLIRVPMIKHDSARSLNLSNAVAIVAYEVMRQWDFIGMH